MRLTASYLPILATFLLLRVVSISGSSSSPSKDKKKKNQSVYNNICGPALPPGRGLKVVKEILKHSSYTAISTPSSPQHQAMCWIIHTDARKLSSRSRSLLQRYALQVLYFATHGTKWITATNWSTSGSKECTWFGVTCDIWGRAVSIELPFNNLDGVIPSEIALLSNLRTLELQMNELHGVIPESMGKLQHLETLKLYVNGIFGEIPSSLGNMKNLKEFYLFGTYMLGNIPTEIGNMKSLETLDLFANNFSGTVPTQITQLKHLRELYLNDNNLVGTIPTLPRMQEMWADCRGKKPEVVCHSCTVCCNDNDTPKCIRRSAPKDKKKIANK